MIDTMTSKFTNSRLFYSRKLNVRGCGGCYVNIVVQKVFKMIFVQPQS